MKKRNVIFLLTLWALVAVFAWFGPKQALSDAERRPLAQFPVLSPETILDGSFMTDFEAYALDQFPLRDTVRKVKSLFHTYLLGQKDNNGIYLVDGYAVQQEYPLNRDSLTHAGERLNHLYQKFLMDSDVYMAIVPDKGYYLAEQAGQLRMDYESLFAYFREDLPWATQIDLTDALSAEDYYRTDTHWRQENILDAAGVICKALGVTPPKQEDYRLTAIDKPFYGVYYGQAALPMEPETLYLMESDLLNNCTVHDYETGKTLSVYDRSRETGKDLYEIFLSGSRSLLTMENPNAVTDRELIVFRDSFGSAMVPLLVQDYAKVTLVDIRYIQIDVLDRFLDFHGQDVLLLYSTLVLNNSETMK